MKDGHKKRSEDNYGSGSRTKANFRGNYITAIGASEEKGQEMQVKG
jgi:hypothetical protein